MANAPTTIAAIKALPEAHDGKTWINGHLEVSISQTKDSHGSGPSKCILTDATGRINGEFWGRPISQYTGQTIRITGKGIRRSSYKGALGVSVPDKCPITILADSPLSPPSGASATQGGAVSVQSTGVFDSSPVRERVHAYLKVLTEVADQYKKLKADLGDRIPSLSAGDIKDIATHISMTYRGEYGSYAKPVFEAPKGAPPEKEHYADDFESPGEEKDDLPWR